MKPPPPSPDAVSSARYSFLPRQLLHAAGECAVVLLVSGLLLQLMEPSTAGRALVALAVLPVVAVIVGAGLQIRNTIAVDEHGVTVRRRGRRTFTPWSHVNAVVSEERVGRVHVGIRLHDRRCATVRMPMLSGRRTTVLTRIAACAPASVGSVVIEHHGPWGAVARDRVAVGRAAA